MNDEQRGTITAIVDEAERALIAAGWNVSRDGNKIFIVHRESTGNVTYRLSGSVPRKQNA